jgi:hypothetical protein
VRKDYLVDLRTEESIKEVADRARNVLDSVGHSDFRIAEGIRRITEYPVLKCGKVQLKLFAAKPNEALAFVQFKPFVALNVDRDLWDEAEENFPWARKVLAHELGHIALHEHYTPTFSGEKDKWIPINERSGEWQADRFSEYYLVHDCDILHHVTPNRIANYCAVEYDLAVRRLGPRFTFSGEICPNCGQIRLIQHGISFICDDCEHEFSCLR